MLVGVERPRQALVVEQRPVASRGPGRSPSRRLRRARARSVPRARRAGADARPTRAPPTRTSSSSPCRYGAWGRISVVGTTATAISGIAAAARRASPSDRAKASTSAPSISSTAAPSVTNDRHPRVRTVVGHEHPRQRAEPVRDARPDRARVGRARSASPGRRPGPAPPGRRARRRITARRPGEAGRASLQPRARRPSRWPGRAVRACAEVGRGSSRIDQREDAVQAERGERSQRDPSGRAGAARRSTRALRCSARPAPRTLMASSNALMPPARPVVSAARSRGSRTPRSSAAGGGSSPATRAATCFSA